MRKYISLGFALVSFLVKSQETEKASVEENLFGVQLSIINTSFQYETKLDRKITLHSELGFGLAFATIKNDDPTIEDEKSTIIYPFINLEPRWYFGLDRRAKLGRNTKNNSANYLSLATTFFSNQTLLLNTGGFNVTPHLSIVPQFGIRRAFAKNFNYEFSGGVGYGYNFFDDAKGCNCSHNNTIIHIQSKIGYNF
ncbi:hypothetical protein SLW70_01740 [Flavobacterium sp. NG2]|uniref:hypothetical protein n=1 Tax=Flavobacterium sp. NG2 TaxID=3097547 RepID=UPI002A80B8BA|nr:hypothetical protein [Flavobacterium sp. NG2]WPR71874.1 hypothetical protein SLW70_01740 [Flavobacterium sp. NG2]